MPLNLGNHILDWQHQVAYQPILKSRIQNYLFMVYCYATGVTSMIHGQRGYLHTILISMIQIWCQWWFWHEKNGKSMVETVPTNVVRIVMVSDFLELILNNNVIHTMVESVQENHQCLANVIALCRHMEVYFGQRYKRLPMPALMAFSSIEEHALFRRCQASTEGNIVNQCKRVFETQRYGLVCKLYY